MTDQPAPTLTERIRQLTEYILTPLGQTLYHWGVHPDAVTIMGTLCVAIGAVCIGSGAVQIGGVVLLFSLPLDSLDGAVARAMQREGDFGAVLDSSLDRYADGMIFAAVGYHYAIVGRFDMLLLALAALLGSLLVSYVRARADGVGVTTKVGLFTRLERTVVIVIMLLVPFLLDWGVLLLAIGTNVTAIQRLWFVYRTLKNKGH